MNETTDWKEFEPGIWVCDLGGMRLAVKTKAVGTGRLTQVGATITGYAASVSAKGPWGQIAATEDKKTLAAAQAWCVEQVPIWHAYLRDRAEALKALDPVGT